MPVAVVTGGASGLRPARSPSGAPRWAWTSCCSTSTASGRRPRRHGCRGARRAWACGRRGRRVQRRGGGRGGRGSGSAPPTSCVSNVGVQLFGAVEAFTDDEWRWLLDVNVTGSARVARAFLPLLRAAAERRRLAFTTSSSILDPASRLGAYQASKFAVWGLAETLRVELADDGIGVSVIFPSGMLTRHLETSEAAQPDHLRRPIANEGDFDAMIASNPDHGLDARHPRGRRGRRDRGGPRRRALRHHPRRPRRGRRRTGRDVGTSGERTVEEQALTRATTEAGLRR